MRVTRCFSFDPVKDKPLLEYIDTLPNASAAVRELLRLDIGVSEGSPLIDKIVKGIVSQLGSGKLSTTPHKIDSLDVQSILSIMNMK